jgi:hypothetical protein
MILQWLAAHCSYHHRRITQTIPWYRYSPGMFVMIASGRMENQAASCMGPAGISTSNPRCSRVTNRVKAMLIAIVAVVALGWSTPLFGCAALPPEDMATFHQPGVSPALYGRIIHGLPLSMTL